MELPNPGLLTARVEVVRTHRGRRLGAQPELQKRPGAGEDDVAPVARRGDLVEPPGVGNAHLLAGSRARTNEVKDHTT